MTSPWRIGIVILGLLPAGLTAQGRAFTPKDWYRLTTLGAPAVSPDGAWVAVTVTTVRETENKRHSEIWVASTDRGDPVRFTSPSTESSNPRWSPDGKLLLFTSTRPGSKVKTWALRMDRPGGEAFEADSLPAGSSPADRQMIVWADTSDVAIDSTRKDPYGKMSALARPPSGAITMPLDPTRFDGRHIVDFPFKSNGPGFIPNRAQARTWNVRQVWARPLQGGPKRQLTAGPYSHGEAVVSPDGKWVAFTADPALRSDSVVAAERDSLAKLKYDSKRDEMPRNDADVFVVPLAGGTPKRLTTMTGSEGALDWSPDGTQVAFLTQSSRTGAVRLAAVPVAGGAPVDLLGDFRYEPSSYRWLPSGKLLLTAAVGGRDALFELDPKTKQPREVVSGRRRFFGVSTDTAARVIAFVASDMTRPTELYVTRGDGTGERQLTHFNDQLNAEIAWPAAERFTFSSVGGLEIEGWLVKPFGYQPGTKYPLVLYIHGGPHAAYGENWFDEFHNLAGAGMWVLYTNPRGSSGYGNTFTYSTRGRWGAEDFQDLMKAVDIVAKRPDVDSTRMGVTGGSYGGFMTAWVTTKTNRFKAAEADRMISNYWSWYGSSDAQGLTEFEFYGRPWENPAIYDSVSPIRHAGKVRTPTLIVQSEEDHRTPITDAEQWFIALKKQGVPAEFVRYPRSTHELSRSGEPWLLVDRLGRLRQWFGYWLKGEPGAMAGGR